MDKIKLFIVRDNIREEIQQQNGLRRMGQRVFGESAGLVHPTILPKIAQGSDPHHLVRPVETLLFERNDAKV